MPPVPAERDVWKTWTAEKVPPSLPPDDDDAPEEPLAPEEVPPPVELPVDPLVEPFPDEELLLPPEDEPPLDPEELPPLPPDDEPPEEVLPVEASLPEDDPSP